MPSIVSSTCAWSEYAAHSALYHTMLSVASIRNLTGDFIPIPALIILFQPHFRVIPSYILTLGL